MTEIGDRPDGAGFGSDPGMDDRPAVIRSPSS